MFVYYDLYDQAILSTVPERFYNICSWSHWKGSVWKFLELSRQVSWNDIETVFYLVSTSVVLQWIHQFWWHCCFVSPSPFLATNHLCIKCLQTFFQQWQWCKGDFALKRWIKILNSNGAKFGGSVTKLQKPMQDTKQQGNLNWWICYKTTKRWNAA